MNSFPDFFIASNTGWPVADTLIAASFFVVLALTVIATFADAVLDHRGKGRFALCTLLVAGLGGGFIRGILWHWAWWIHHWAEAALFGDIIVGTLIFFVKGAVMGAGAGFFLRVMLALPQAFLLNLLSSRAKVHTNAAIARFRGRREQQALPFPAIQPLGGIRTRENPDGHP